MLVEADELGGFSAVGFFYVLEGEAYLGLSRFLFLYKVLVHSESCHLSRGGSCHHLGLLGVEATACLEVGEAGAVGEGGVGEEDEVQGAEVAEGLEEGGVEFGEEGREEVGGGEAEVEEEGEVAEDEEVGDGGVLTEGQEGLEDQVIFDLVAHFINIILLL